MHIGLSDFFEFILFTHSHTTAANFVEAEEKSREQEEGRCLPRPAPRAPRPSTRSEAGVEAEDAEWSGVAHALRDTRCSRPAPCALRPSGPALRAA